MIPLPNLAIRWTIGNISTRGFEALRLSIHCAVRLFGASAIYVVCVNNIGIEHARAFTGNVPSSVLWLDNSQDLPAPLYRRFEEGMSEGVGWKLAPLRLFPERHEIALDNDVILWDLPLSIKAWLQQGERCLIAQDVQRCLGQFDDLAPAGAYNSGIRGLPPGLDFESALNSVLARADRQLSHSVLLTSELDEQGLQVAAVNIERPALVVTTEEVSICSPFWPKQPNPGACGAHFVGLNARHLPWDYYDRPADQWMEEHWSRHRGFLYQRAGLTVLA